MMHDLVPTILITGFLGSGKTTLINRILSSHPDKKISLILNEFGDIKLESKFIEVKGVGMVSELSGGCLCCVASVDLPRIIRYTLEQAPATEYLIIEASGLSDPDPVRATLTSYGLSTLIHLDTVVAVVDADNFETTAKVHPLVMSQIAEADYAILSKTQTHSKEDVDRLLQRVSSIGLGTKTFVWDDSFDTSIIFDPPFSPHILKAEHHHHSHVSFDQYYYLSKEKHDISLINRVLSELPANILRVKGYSDNYLLQKVGSRIDIRMAKQPIGDYQTAILVIGTELNKLILQKLFASAKLSQ
ncbi:MAG: GTP-binding protein [Candidatus Moraniibacteriota bacterium]|nr:MAG: GTP-binding protein [Candidatus Moranbacteria bacterium]